MINERRNENERKKYLKKRSKRGKNINTEEKMGKKGME